MSNELIVQDSKLQATIVKAELDTQIATANAYPRDEIASIEKAIKLACLDEETAAGCFYALPRKDKNGNNIFIEGESIRLAEIMRSTWKHMHTETRVVEVTERYIDTAAVCWDLQNNNKHIATDRISIWFGEKNGRGGYRANNDMQIMLAKASQAKALRNAIFMIIGKSNVQAVARQAKKFALGAQKPLITRVTAAVTKLVKMGVNKEELMAFFGYTTMSEFTEEDYSSLIGVGTSLKEGFIKPEELFVIEKDAGSENANDVINILIANKKAQQTQNPAEVVNAVTGEVLPADNNDDLPSI